MTPALVAQRRSLGIPSFPHRFLSSPDRPVLQPLPAQAGCRVPLAPPGLRSSVQPPASRSVRCGVCERARAASAWRRQKTEAHPRLRSPWPWVAGAGATLQSGATRHQQNLAPAGRRLSARPPVRQSVPASVRSSLRPPHTATPPASAIAAGNARRWCSAEILRRSTSPARTAPHPAASSCSAWAPHHDSAPRAACGRARQVLSSLRLVQLRRSSSLPRLRCGIT